MTELDVLGHGSGAELVVEQDERHRWLRALHDRVHEALCHQEWSAIWDVLRSIPVELEENQAPGPAEDLDAPEAIDGLVAGAPFDDDADDTDDLEQP